MPTKKLITSIITTIILLNAVIKTPSSKIIFVPFLICSISMVGKSISQIFHKQKLEIIFGKLFTLGFASFFIGFLLVAAYTCIRDKIYDMLIFALPFLFVGIPMIKRKLGYKSQEEKRKSSIPFGIIMSVGLVFIVLLAGIIILIMGIKRMDAILIFMGIFFTFGGFTFVLAALTIRGCFDNYKIDVIGTYIGVLFVVIGIGTIVLKFREFYSMAATMRGFGLWIIIPVLMILVGVIQIIKCIRNRQYTE